MKTLLTLIFLLSTTSAFSAFDANCAEVNIQPEAKCNTNKIAWIVGLPFSFSYTCTKKKPTQTRRGTTSKTRASSKNFESYFACNEVLKDLKTRANFKGDDDALKISTKRYSSTASYSGSYLRVTTVGNKSLLEYMGKVSASSGHGKTAGAFRVGRLNHSVKENFDIRDLRNGDIIQVLGGEFKF